MLKLGDTAGNPTKRKPSISLIVIVDKEVKNFLLKVALIFKNICRKIYNKLSFLGHFLKALTLVALLGYQALEYINDLISDEAYDVRAEHINNNLLLGCIYFDIDDPNPFMNHLELDRDDLRPLIDDLTPLLLDLGSWLYEFALTLVDLRIYINQEQIGWEFDDWSSISDYWGNNFNSWSDRLYYLSQIEKIMDLDLQVDNLKRGVDLYMDIPITSDIEELNSDIWNIHEYVRSYKETWADYFHRWWHDSRYPLRNPLRYHTNYTSSFNYFRFLDYKNNMADVIANKYN